jgi:hypothetical protein
MPQLQEIFTVAQVKLRPERAENHDILVNEEREDPYFATPPQSSDEDQTEERTVEIENDSVNMPPPPPRTPRNPIVTESSEDNYTFDIHGRAVRRTLPDDLAETMSALSL